MIPFDRIVSSWYWLIHLSVDLLLLEMDQGLIRWSAHTIRHGLSRRATGTVLVCLFGFLRFGAYCISLSSLDENIVITLIWEMNKHDSQNFVNLPMTCLGNNFTPSPTLQGIFLSVVNSNVYNQSYSLF